jgi:uncharacterized protein (DUF2147 family)
MKRITVGITAMSLMFAAIAWYGASIEADDVRGLYWNAEKTAQIRIYRAKNDKYYGKIEMLTEPNNANGTPKKDSQNPKANLRDRDRLGMVIMNGFTWNIKENKWEDGTIYDPNEGKTYDGYMYFEGNNKSKLKLRGYVMGMTWLGRTSEWQRIK